MEIAQGVGAQQQVPGDLSRPGRLIRLLPPPVVNAASWARIASMALWRLVSAAVRSEEVAKGPGALERQDVGIVAVQPGVPQAQGRVQDRLGHLAQKRGGDLLVPRPRAWS